MEKKRVSSAEKGRLYELHVAKKMRKHGYIFVKVCGKSGDMGADIIARKLPFFRKTVVQCKCYNWSIPADAVREAYTAKKIFGASIAVVATNSMLTKEARETAKKTGVRVWEGY